MIRNAVMACILAGVAGSAAQATNVEFRIIERRGQSTWDGVSNAVPLNDNLLNFSVQARVVGGVAGESLGNFGFDIVSSDPQSAGTLTRASITALDGSYQPTNYLNSNSVGRGGLAGSYAYLAGINGQFNGLINVDGGSFTANPAINQIGLVTGSPTGSNLLLQYDQGGQGFPSTAANASSTTAPVDQAIADQFFGADGNWIQVYNFNYTVSSNAARVLTFSLANAQAQTYTFLGQANTVWGPGDPTDAMQVSTAPITISITPAPGAAALLGLGGLVAARRRRTA